MLRAHRNAIVKARLIKAQKAVRDTVKRPRYGAVERARNRAECYRARFTV